MSIIKKFVLLCALPFTIHPQNKQDLGKIYYQLNYRPGDWVTIGSTRYSTSVAVSQSLAYIGTLGGIVRYDFIRNQFLYPLSTGNGLLDNDILLVTLDPQTQIVWIASRTGLQTYDPFSERVASATYFQCGFISDETVTGIAFDNGQTWIRTNKSTYVSPASFVSLRKITLPEDREFQWAERTLIKPGSIPHLFTSGQIDLQFNDFESSFIDQDFRRYAVTNFVGDRFGRTWATTAGAGTWVSQSKGGLYSSISYGLAASSVRAMTFDGPDLWIASKDNLSDSPGQLSGITQWNQDKDVFQYHYTSFRLGLKVDQVNALLADSLSLWVGTIDGLYQYNKATRQWSGYGSGAGLYDPNILSIERNGGRLLIGTAQGLNYALASRKGYVVYKSDIPELWNTAVYRMRPNGHDLWVVTDRGIYLLDSDLRVKKHFTALGFEVSPSGLLNQTVRGIAESSTSFYFASELAIVEYDKKSETWISIPVNSSFLQIGVNDAVYDKGNLWVATQSGALRYIVAKQKWIFYGVPDGLAGESVTSILPDGDFVWFGTNRGLTQFHWNAEYLKE